MKFLGFLFFLLVLAAGAAAYLVLSPFGPSQETFVDIATGTPSREMARQLQVTCMGCTAVLHRDEFYPAPDG